MSLLELLRSQARRYRCEACGASMAECGITILAQQDNRALVRVTCARCNDENLVQVVIQTDAEGAPARRRSRPRPRIDEGRPATSAPIDADEVLDLHRVLDDHQGDLRSLLEPRSRTG